MNPKLPEWLAPGNLAYAKRQVRTSKSEPLVELVTILEVISPYVIRVEYQATGRRETVSTRHLYRCPQPIDQDIESESDDISVDDEHSNNAEPIFNLQILNDDNAVNHADELDPEAPQRQRRVIRPPIRLNDYVTD